jgi:hypothetical protein
VPFSKRRSRVLKRFGKYFQAPGFAPVIDHSPRSIDNLRAKENS